MSRTAGLRPWGTSGSGQDGWSHGVPPPNRLGDQPLPLSASLDTRVRVALIEDNRLARDQLSALLNREPDLRVVATGVASTLGLAHIQAAAPDVIVLDARSGGATVQDCLRRGKELLPEARFIVLNVAASILDVMACIERGANGFVLAEATVDELLGTIRTAARGGCVLPDPLTPKIFSHLAEPSTQDSSPADDDRSSCLTDRERWVEALIAEGLTNRAIAGRLGVSVHTIKCHVRSILKKHGLGSRLQVAVHFQAPGAHGRPDALPDRPAGHYLGQPACGSPFRIRSAFPK